MSSFRFSVTIDVRVPIVRNIKVSTRSVMAAANALPAGMPRLVKANSQSNSKVPIWPGVIGIIDRIATVVDPSIIRFNGRFTLKAVKDRL